MSPKLRPLILPQMVERRRQRESGASDSELELSSSCYTQNSSASDFPSPVTPTFSTRGHLRHPSSCSSLESPFLSCAADSNPSSPTFSGSKSGKFPLPDVQEEPHERDEDDFDMLEDANSVYDCLCDDQQCIHHDPSMAQSSVHLSMKHEFEYDLADGFFSDGEVSTSPRSKKRRANDSTINNLTMRFGTRFPSFSRRWRLRKTESAASLNSDAVPYNSASRSASSRSSSISTAGRQTAEDGFDLQLPPTPTCSAFGSREEISLPIDIEKANRHVDDCGGAMATTPLLPPLMMDASANTTQMSILSPLQSPSVAEPKESFSGSVTPIDSITTPQFAGIPSPPLSTKPSISSFHFNAANRPGHLVPSSEIPPIVIADPDDEWANNLGHANYTIYPEPYIPVCFDLEACRQLRTNWDLARCNYTKHLVRTGEHYGVTSKTYKLTEAKWVFIDATWRKNNELTITNTVDNGSSAFASLKHNTLGGANDTNIMTKIPSLNDPRSQGKFPQMGDEDIVGPMVQVAAQLQRTPSKKAKLFKFIAEKFPASLSTART